MKLSDTMKVWDVLHVMDTGLLGYCDFEKAIDAIVGIEDDINCPAIPEQNSTGIGTDNDAIATKSFGPIKFVNANE